MTAGRYAVLSNGVVVNVILWEETNPYESENGTELVLAPESVSIGWERVADEWVAPEVPEPEPIPEVDNSAKLAAMEELMTTLGLTEATARVMVGLPPL